MTDMYDGPKQFDGKLKPYPAESKGVEVRNVLLRCCCCELRVVAVVVLSVCVCSYKSDNITIVSVSRFHHFYYNCALIKIIIICAHREAAPKTPSHICNRWNNELGNVKLPTKPLNCFDNE